MSALAQPLTHFFTSSIGRKILVALTGVILVIYVLGHMIGNLLIFMGKDAINEYGHMLHTLGHGMAIWIARAVMLAAVVIHVYVTLKLAAENRAARGSERYGYSTVIKARRSSLIMHWTGLLLLAFIIYHLLHFTFRVNNDYNTYTAMVDGKPVHDVYRMVIAGFSWWPASAFYIIAMGCLCSHLSHGVSSMFQTLGLSTEKTRPGIQLFSYAYAVLIFVGNCSIPLAVLMGYFNK